MSKTVEKLNLYLANLNVLYRKVQNYHWNIVGTGFFSVHAKLEEYYDALNEQIDDVAERILSIGGRPLGTLKDYLAVTTIKEAENKEISIADAVADVKKEFEAMLKLVKEVKETAEDTFGRKSFDRVSLLNFHIAFFIKKCYNSLLIKN